MRQPCSASEPVCFHCRPPIQTQKKPAGRNTTKPKPRLQNWKRWGRTPTESQTVATNPSQWGPAGGGPPLAIRLRAAGASWTTPNRWSLSVIPFASAVSLSSVRRVASPGLSGNPGSTTGGAWGSTPPHEVSWVMLTDWVPIPSGKSDNEMTNILASIGAVCLGHEPYCSDAHRVSPFVHWSIGRLVSPLSL